MPRRQHTHCRSRTCSLGPAETKPRSPPPPLCPDVGRPTGHQTARLASGRTDPSASASEGCIWPPGRPRSLAPPSRRSPGPPLSSGRSPRACWRRRPHAARNLRTGQDVQRLGKKDYPRYRAAERGTWHTRVVSLTHPWSRGWMQCSRSSRRPRSSSAPPSGNTSCPSGSPTESCPTRRPSDPPQRPCHGHSR